MAPYPFFESPALADFMLVVVEHFLPHLDHLVAHVLDLRHSLKTHTQEKHCLHPVYDNHHLHVMSKLLVLQPKIYITMSLTETRSL